MIDEIHMEVSVPTDDEGYILLQCEHCGTLFKIAPSDIRDERVLHIFCPSCGLLSDSYITDDVKKLATSIESNRVDDVMYDALKNLERNSKNKTIKFDVGKRHRRENEDPIYSGIETLEICNFPCCKRTAKIKPLLKMTGAYCPFCGVKNYEIE